MIIENLFWIGYVGAAAGLLFAILQARKVFSYSEGNEAMVKIATAIRTGANAFMKRQYTTVGVFLAVMFVILSGFAYIPLLMGAERGLLNPFTPFAFITGGTFTALCGVLGMKISTYANARTAFAATESLNKALRVAFSSGSFMGFVVNGLAILEITVWYMALKYWFKVDDQTIAHTMITFGMGVAVVAVFARVGGGIFTKAADVGADLVGKVEAGIPEDDPRNPAVIADNVGDNVGDVAGMGADLHESNSNALVATIAISFGAGYGVAGFMLPIIVSVIGILASIIGTFFVRTKEVVTQQSLLNTLRKGVYIAGGIAAIATLPLIKFIANNAPEGSTMAENAWGIYGAVLVGIAAGFIVSLFTEYYTSDASKPTRELAESSDSGSAPLMIGGLSLGMRSAAGPLLTIGGAAIVSFIISGGFRYMETGLTLDYNIGLYGIGLAAVAMLATNAIILATDAFGPVADNAGGIAQMAGLPAEVRERTDALDALGNTTAATGKGFAIASNAFTGLALLVSYVNIAELEIGHALNLSIVNPPVLIGFFAGAAVVFLFAALCMSAVQRAAQKVVQEVRRQFREIKGLLEGKPGVEADYATCVDICTRGALKEMIAPAMLTILSPIIVGLLLGAAGVVGYLAGIIVIGFSMAVFMLNSGGAWDNAKKYIEAGHLGGKGSENHKAAVLGDTVGDPLKDTAGPSFNNVITVSCTVAIVFIGITIAFSLL
ncbi:MAG: sodium-translocating pyrophosphatase [Dysgonamonadaceae bacterium]|jgi:K(+)-stimulated pyrophosphate-energized sodium pump|nr:sodium-translocating pyrophosphatase [Dysgonamonadaceae bacterium]